MKKIIVSLFVVTLLLSGCGKQEMKELENLPTSSYVEQNQYINIKNGSDYFTKLNQYLNEKNIIKKYKVKMK